MLIGVYGFITSKTESDFKTENIFSGDVTGKFNQNISIFL